MVELGGTSLGPQDGPNRLFFPRIYTTEAVTTVTWLFHGFGMVSAEFGAQRFSMSESSFRPSFPKHHSQHHGPRRPFVWDTSPSFNQRPGLFPDLGDRRTSPTRVEQNAARGSGTRSCWLPVSALFGRTEAEFRSRVRLFGLNSLRGRRRALLSMNWFGGFGVSSRGRRTL